jgi:hypothetical protein
MAGGSGRRRFDVQLFEWTLNLSDRIHRDARIARRRIDVAMAEQSLNDANIDLLFQQMRREAVSQRVHGDIFIEAGRLGSVVEDPLQRSGGNRLQRIGAGKEPMGRLGSLSIVAKDAEQLLGEHHVAILASFAVTDGDDHAGAVNIATGESDEFGHAQAGGVDGDKGRAHLQIADGLQEPPDLFTGENGGQGVLPSGVRNLIDNVFLPERLSVEKPQRPHDRIDRSRLEFACNKMKVIGAHIFQAELVRRASMISAESGNSGDIDILGIRRHVANLHIVDHALAQW